MQTSFTDSQRADPDIANSERVIRKCVHCGFCTATCPTYILLGDERDSPRGRIYMIKEMLEDEQAPTKDVVTHIDRCLSCLGCMTTCPSDVNYMHLVDHARAYIEKKYKRPWVERFWRRVLQTVLPFPGRFRFMLSLGRLARPLKPLFRLYWVTRPAAAMLDLVPTKGKSAHEIRQSVNKARGKVILLQGCAEHVLEPSIREATVRVLNRAGYEVIFAPREKCCGSLVHHLGAENDSHRTAKHNVGIWSTILDDPNVVAILTSVSGCATTMKNYGFMLRNDNGFAERAELVASRVRDLSEFLAEMDWSPEPEQKQLSIAYHAPCTQQHGQQIVGIVENLLRAAGFTVMPIPEGHVCCGSAGTYNILQSQLAGDLKKRKLSNIDKTQADIVATANIGCLQQLATGATRPIVHFVELLDWASGGPMPPGLAKRAE